MGYRCCCFGGGVQSAARASLRARARLPGPLVCGDLRGRRYCVLGLPKKYGFGLHQPRLPASTFGRRSSIELRVAWAAGTSAALPQALIRTDQAETSRALKGRQRPFAHHLQPRAHFSTGNDFYSRISLRFSSNSALSISPFANRSFKISMAREVVSCSSGFSRPYALRP